jgi:GntR family transcriptional regulator / MocR family aminotransferase
MGTSSADVLVQLDRSRPRALRAQIEDELREAIRTGRLAPGTTLPSTRALAADLGLTRGVVVEAYDQLVAEGYLVSRAGSGTAVNHEVHQHMAPSVAPAERSRLEIDFRTGLPDLSAFPRAAWLAATRAALQSLPDSDLAYGDPRGMVELRRVLTEYLGRVRGVTTHPDQVVVCNSFGQGFRLAAEVLARRGVRAFAVEDPGYDGPRLALESMGLPFHGLPVDADGLVVDRLRATPARAVVLTPAHQSPTGAVLSADRRRQLLDWAREVDGYVIEDDYDAEYRYDRRPIGAMQGIGADRVIYGGTASKSLAPGIRLGWLVLPPALVEPVVQQRRAIDAATSALLQATYAVFVSKGDLDRHLRRTRRIYRQRRDALIVALQRWLPEATPCGASAGLHVLVELPPRVDEAAVVERARQAGVGVYGLSSYRIRPSVDDPPGLVLGFGGVAPESAERGVRRLAEAAGDLLD